jgi:hypothetical protein
VELVTPAQHVGLKRAWAKNGPGKSRRLHRLLRLEVVSPIALPAAPSCAELDESSTTCASQRASSSAGSAA